MRSLLETFRNGGPVMYVILVVRHRGLAIFLERFYVIVIRSTINGPHSSSASCSSCGPEGGGREFFSVVRAVHSPLPDMGLLILRSKSRDEGELQNVADAASLSVIPRLSAGSSICRCWRTVATLIGLFGTIYGLKGAFASVAAAPAAQRSRSWRRVSPSR